MSVLLIFLVFVCHWQRTFSEGSEKAKNHGEEYCIATDSEKTRSMAQRILEKIQESDDRPESWNHLVSVMEFSFGLSANAPDPSVPVLALSTKKEEITARCRALRWMAHEDIAHFNNENSLLYRYALAAIYFGTSGGDSAWSRCSATTNDSTTPMIPSSNKTHCESDNERFLSPENELKWHGINGKNGKLTWLDLSSINLVSEHFLPLELTLLSPSLELLWLSENYHLSGILPDWLGDFESLQSLSLYRTNLGGTLPESIYKLSDLTSLRLYKSQFSGTISKNIEDMSELKWLWLHNNQFTGTVPDELGNLEYLEGLTLHGNKFDSVSVTTGASAEDTKKLSKVKRLKSNVIPESVCLLREEKLQHLWADCEEGSLVPVRENQSENTTESKYILKEGVEACSCCTRCFPRNDHYISSFVSSN